MLSQSEREDLIFLLSQGFRPSSPIDSQDLFRGRHAQIEKVLDAINSLGHHLIIYGDRGVGKTSIANMIALNLASPLEVVIAPHVNCTCLMTPDEVWQCLFLEIGFIAKQKHLTLPESFIAIESRIRNSESVVIDQQLAREVLYELSLDHSVVLIVDEFDALEATDTKFAIAEAIKSFSDRRLRVTVVIVGVSEDVATLFDGHPSIERCTTQVDMPRMEREEIEAIVTTTLARNEIGMTVAPLALQQISRIAKGLPHFGHRIGLESAKSAVNRNSRTVEVIDVEAGIHTAIDQTHASIRSVYWKATHSAKTNARYKEALLACALVQCDDMGCFNAVQLELPLRLILGKEYKVAAFARHLHTFCQDERGPMLRKASLPGGTRYKFYNPLLEPYVLLKGFQDGLLTDHILSETRDRTDPQMRAF